MIKLVQVDPSEAVHIYKQSVKTMPVDVVDMVLDRFIASGLKCCRIDTDEYLSTGMMMALTNRIKQRKLRDTVVNRQNLSKVYLVRR